MGKRHYPRFEDLNVGDPAPELVKDKITRTDIVKYAGASGDFVSIHHDDLVAIRSGEERLFAMGMMGSGYLGHMVTDWLGAGTLRKFSVKMYGRVWPGDILTCQGVVARKYAEGKENRVECDVWVENQHKEKVITGKVIAALQ